jgi:adenylate cyclase
MDATADWPTRVEELRFDPLDPSDPTWHRCEPLNVLYTTLSALSGLGQDSASDDLWICFAGWLSPSHPTQHRAHIPTALRDLWQGRTAAPDALCGVQDVLN